MPSRDELFDFRAFGQALKAARIKKGYTRDQAAAIFHIDPRYLTNIENKGQHPSLQVFYKLATYYNLSVDEFFYLDMEPDKSSRRRHLERILDTFDDKDLIIMEATAEGISESKESEE